MVNPLARANMKNYLKDREYENTIKVDPVKNLDSNESNLIKRIIQGEKVTQNTAKVLTLDEAVERIKNKF